MAVQTIEADVVERRTFYRHHWHRLFRPMTWSGSVIPALIGTIAPSKREPVRIEVVLVFLAAAVLVQSITNLWNDYYDFLHGQDVENWVVAPGRHDGLGPSRMSIRTVGFVLTCVAVCLGVWLAIQSSWYILAVGGACMVVGYLYSAGPKPLSALGLGEITAALFMGPVVTMLAFCVQQPLAGTLVWFASVPMALLIGSMILTNNLRDIEKDYPSRRTVPIRIGRKQSVTLLTWILVAAYAWVVLLIACHVLPKTDLLVILGLPAALRLRLSLRMGAGVSIQQSAMKWSAIHHLMFGMLFVIGLWL